MSAASDHQMSTDDRLIYMANQIVRNFAMMAEPQAAEGAADHMLAFWDPRMKFRIGALLSDQPDKFLAVAARAVLRMQTGLAVSQTSATEFNKVDQAGHSDAG